MTEYQISGNNLFIRYDNRPDWETIMEAVLKALGRERGGFSTIQMVCPVMWPMAVKLVAATE